MGWLDDGTYEEKATVIGVIGLAGIAIGSQLGSKAIQLNGKQNLIRVIFFWNFLAVFMNFIKFY